ncbi:MAG: TlpA disulfide reductase family protein [Planctomycetota bacterium]|jgi:tetratricopeptide (TPR) repeat protein
MKTLLPRRCAAGLAAAVAVAPVRADKLRNIAPGEAIPDFSLPALDGTRIGRAELEGKVVILVFLAGEQKSSEGAAATAHDVWRSLRHDDLALVYVSADTVQAPYFRRQRDATGVHEPFGLDFDRTLYGGLGLIVVPTTIVIDRDWRLAHVISSYKSDYEHVLRAYAEHALGDLDDEALERRLETQPLRRDRPEDRIARHRATAEILRQTGPPEGAEKELLAALAIDPAHADTRLDLAALLLATERREEAEEIVDAVLKANPEHRRARLLHGVVLYHAGELDEAATVLREALLLNPDPVHTHYYLGLIYEKKGDTTRALEHYREALKRLLKDRSL